MTFVQKFPVNADIVTVGAGQAGVFARSHYKRHRLTAGLTKDVLLPIGERPVSFKRGVSINLAGGL
ncbi:hypothetical protein [Paraburkholderia dinghuensis]|uniref:Uncharacterized protein n=1 Tax=Paraburkholderia dinghuensis TaxID=2305225 RepID=A0A3N6ME02_9BURK|nr:hypothetical protein [Paraburkholderia dinghuensis]RQH02099.1 hypothetical protein D1Y85_22670 [Paraburkholderia dinghuensis]